MKRLITVLIFVLLLPVVGWGTDWKPRSGLSLSLGTGAGGGGGFSYTLNDSFFSGDLSGTPACTPGPGIRAIVTDTGGNASITGGNLSYANRVSDVDPNISLTPTNTSGNVLSLSVTPPAANTYLYPKIYNTPYSIWGLYNGLLNQVMQGRGNRSLSSPAFSAGVPSRLVTVQSGKNMAFFRNETLYAIFPYEYNYINGIRLECGNPRTYPFTYPYVKIAKYNWIPSAIYSYGFTQTDTILSPAIWTSCYDSSGNLAYSVGNSVYKSTGNGNNPVLIKTFAGSDTIIESVWFDANDNLYCSPYGTNVTNAERGLWRVPAGSTTATRVLDQSALTNPNGIWSMAENSSGIIYAGNYGGHAYIYKSSDATGTSFALDYDASDGGTYAHIHNLCIVPSGALQDNVYATLGDTGSLAIAKYNIGTTTWSILTPAGKIQALGCAATATCRLFGMDASTNGVIYRTTDDSTFDIVYGPDTGDYAAGNKINCWWMRKDSTGNIYAGWALGGNGTYKSKILVSPVTDDGQRWLTYRRWSGSYSYDGTQQASNISGNNLCISSTSNSIIQSGTILNLSPDLTVSDGMGHTEPREGMSYPKSGINVALTTLSGTPAILGRNLLFTTAGSVICDPGQANVIIKCTFKTPVSGTDPAYIIFRYSDANNYWCIKIIPGTAGNDFQLIKVESGSPSIISEADIDWAVNTEYTVHISCMNNYILADYWQGWILPGTAKPISTTDAFNATATKVGIKDDANSNFAFGGGYGGLCVFPMSGYNNLLQFTE